MVLIFDLLILAFFGRGELLVCHSEFCRLVSGLYSKIHDSSLVMTCLKKFRHFRCVQEDPGTHSFGFPTIRWWGFLGPAWHKFSACPVPQSKFRGPLVIQIQLSTDHSDCQSRSDLTRALTLVTFSPVFDMQGLPERGFSSSVKGKTESAAYPWYSHSHKEN